MLPAAALLSLLACATSDDDSAASGALLSEAGLYSLVVAMSPDPPTVGDSTLTVDLHDAETDQLVTGATLQVTPWMPDHDHGISDAPEVVEDGGVYTVRFAYSMPGSWELTFDIDGSPGVDSAVLAVEVE